MWPAQNQTEELLLQAKKGNPEAVSELMDRHRDALRQVVRMRLDRRIQQRVDVSDVVQDVLVEANRRFQDYLENPAMSFRLWLRQIAQDRIIDAHRRHRGSARRSVDREHAAPAGIGTQSSIQLASELSDHQLTPAAIALQNELAHRIEAAIYQLNEGDRDIVLMRHYEQLSNQEISQALNLSESAASMRYLRALRRLKEILQDSTLDPEKAD